MPKYLITAYGEYDGYKDHQFEMLAPKADDAVTMFRENAITRGVPDTRGDLWFNMRLQKIEWIPETVVATENINPS